MIINTDKLRKIINDSSRNFCLNFFLKDSSIQFKNRIEALKNKRLEQIDEIEKLAYNILDEELFCANKETLISPINTSNGLIRIQKCIHISMRESFSREAMSIIKDFLNKDNKIYYHILDIIKSTEMYCDERGIKELLMRFDLINGIDEETLESGFVVNIFVGFNEPKSESFDRKDGYFNFEQVYKFFVK